MLKATLRKCARVLIALVLLVQAPLLDSGAKAADGAEKGSTAAIAAIAANAANAAKAAYAANAANAANATNAATGSWKQYAATGSGKQPGAVPTALALTFQGDPATARGFAWYTAPGITGTKLQVVEASQVAGGAWPTKGFVTFSGHSTPIRTYETLADKKAGTMTAYADHKVTATGLKPGTAYRYRAGDGLDNHWSPVGAFTTAAADTEAFTFLYTTDPQGTTEKDYDTWNHTLQAAVKTFPTAKFIAVTGDLVDNGDIENQWKWLLNQPQAILAKTPLVPVVGNHESKAHPNFGYHFNLPNVSNTGAKPDGSVYSFDYGPAHFMVINTEYNEASGADAVYEKQVRWLRSEAAGTKKKWKIVLLHRSPYSVASHSSDTDVLFFRKKLTGLFDELGIDLVLSGHDHTYTRTYPMYGNVPQTNTKKGADGSLLNPKGTLYLVSNAAGIKRYTPKSGPFPYAVKFGQPNKEMFSGVTVTASEIAVQAYTTTVSGPTALYDSVRIRK